MKIANKVSKRTYINSHKSTQLCGLDGVRRRILEAGFCCGFVAQWFTAALVRHPGFESRSCQFFALLLFLPAG